MQYACTHDDTGDTVSLLLRKQCRANNKGCLQVTPLHLAARYGCEASVRALLNDGADPRLRDALNRTPLRLAWDKDIAALLTDAVKTQSQPTPVRRCSNF